MEDRVGPTESRTLVTRGHLWNRGLLEEEPSGWISSDMRSWFRRGWFMDLLKRVVGGPAESRKASRGALELHKKLGVY